MNAASAAIVRAAGQRSYRERITVPRASGASARKQMAA
jgi:hypothetical protein